LIVLLFIEGKSFLARGQLVLACEQQTDEIPPKMKYVSLLRHAKAAPADHSGDDFARPLTEAGRTAAIRVGDGTRDEIPDLIFVRRRDGHGKHSTSFASLGRVCH